MRSLSDKCISEASLKVDSAALTRRRSRGRSDDLRTLQIVPDKKRTDSLDMSGGGGVAPLVRLPPRALRARPEGMAGWTNLVRGSCPPLMLRTWFAKLSPTRHAPRPRAGMERSHPCPRPALRQNQVGPQRHRDRRRESGDRRRGVDMAGLSPRLNREKREKRGIQGIPEIPGGP